MHRKRRQFSLIDGDGKEPISRNVDNGSEAMLAIRTPWSFQVPLMRRLAPGVAKVPTGSHAPGGTRPVTLFRVSFRC